MESLINSFITNLVNIAWGVALGAFILFFIVGAFIYMSASGNTRQMDRGKSAMMNATAGLVLVLSARIIGQTFVSAIPH